MMDFLNFFVIDIHDATKLSVVSGKSIFNWFSSKFQEIHHIPGTFHCHVTKDFRSKTIILGDVVESYYNRL